MKSLLVIKLFMLFGISAGFFRLKDAVLLLRAFRDDNNQAVSSNDCGNLIRYFHEFIFLYLFVDDSESSVGFFGPIILLPLGVFAILGGLIMRLLKTEQYLRSKKLSEELNKSIDEYRRHSKIRM